MSSFNFPVLSRREIVAILVESRDIKISESDLVNPSPKFVFDIYSALLMALDPLLEEDHGQVDFDALEQFENPDLHVEPVRVFNFFNKIREVLNAVGVPEKNFMLSDLIKPDANRTVVFLSAILNFILHKDAKMDLLEPHVEFSSLEEQCREKDATITQLQAEIAEHNERVENEAPIVQEFQAKVKELQHLVSNLNNKQLSLRASMRKMKEKALEMDEKISKAEFELVQSVQENANLQSRIVSSPDKLQSALEEIKSLQLKAKESEKLAMQCFQDKSAILEVYMKALKKMSKHFTQMQAMQDQFNSAKAIEKDVKQHKAKLSDDGVLDMSLEAKLVERQSKVEHLDQHKKKLERERDISCNEERNELNKVKLEVESSRRDFEAWWKKIEAMRLQVDAATSRISSVKEAAVAKQQQLLKKCEEVVNEYHRYSNSIAVCYQALA